MKKRLLGVLLTLALLVSMMAMPAFADKGDTEGSTELDYAVAFADADGEESELNTFVDTAFVMLNADETYTIFFSLTTGEDGATSVSSVSFEDEELSPNGGGLYTITVDSIEEAIAVTAVVSDGTDEETVEACLVIDDGEEEAAEEEEADLEVVIPEGLADGTYVGSTTVEHDENEQFNEYPISVSVTVADGAIESFTVTGADDSNTQYSYRAETGLNEQLAGASEGTVSVDAVSMATCSSKAIVTAINDALESGSPTDTTLELGEAIYDPEGTQVTLTIGEPEEDVDYSNIAVSYAVGKFASDLVADTDFTVELVSSDESEIVYLITINPNDFVIEDDDLTHEGNYNALGMNLDIAVAGTTAGRITITSGAAVTLEDNALALTGGNGETLEDYIEGIDEVTIAYTDEDGTAVSETYSTQWQHDTEPEYTPDDIFGEDGAVNFDCGIFALGADGTYTITISASGFADLTAQVGAAE